MDIYGSQISAADTLFSRRDNTQPDTLDTNISFTPSSKRSREIVTGMICVEALTKIEKYETNTYS